MGGTEASQRPVKQDYQVTAHHAWKPLPVTDNYAPQLCVLVGFVACAGK